MSKNNTALPVVTLALLFSYARFAEAQTVNTQAL